MKKVAVSGNFYPLHDGHILLFQKAKELGDYLIAILGNDNHLRRKNKPIYLSLPYRIKTVEPFVDEVIVAIDDDATINKTLELIRPDIYATGDDWTEKNLPEREICQQLNIEVKSGMVKRLHSSREILKNAQR